MRAFRVGRWFLVYLAALAVWGSCVRDCPGDGAGAGPATSGEEVETGQIARALGVHKIRIEYPNETDVRMNLRGAGGEELGTTVIVPAEGTMAATFTGVDGSTASYEAFITAGEEEGQLVHERVISGAGGTVRTREILVPARAASGRQDWLHTALLQAEVPAGADTPSVGYVDPGETGLVATLVTVQDGVPAVSMGEVHHWIDAVGLAPLMRDASATYLIASLQDQTLSQSLERRLTESGVSVVAQPIHMSPECVNTFTLTTVGALGGLCAGCYPAVAGLPASGGWSALLAIPACVGCAGLLFTAPGYYECYQSRQTRMTLELCTQRSCPFLSYQTPSVDPTEHLCLCSCDRAKCRETFCPLQARQHGLSLRPEGGGECNVAGQCFCPWTDADKACRRLNTNYCGGGRFILETLRYDCPQAECGNGKVEPRCREKPSLNEQCDHRATPTGCPEGKRCNSRCKCEPCDCGPGARHPNACPAARPICDGCNCIPRPEAGPACLAGGGAGSRRPQPLVQAQTGDEDCPVCECSCVYDADCAGVEGCGAGGCQCVNEACVPATPECETDEECDVGQMCIDGACFNLECTSDEDCVLGGRCVEGTCTSPCSSNADCGQGEMCRDGRCGRAQCTTDVDCPPRHTCEDGRCVVGACVTDAHCPAGNICEDGTCIPQPCTTDADCPTGISCEEGVCGAPRCVTDADCPEGDICEAGSCISFTCTTDADCPLGQTCQAGSCVAAGCTTDADCPSGECTNGQCTPTGCVRSDECTVGDICVAGSCVSGACTTNADCPPERNCVEQACVPAPCTSDTDCPAGIRCVSGTCGEPGCRRDDQCAAGERCDTTSWTCVPTGCTSDAECALGEVCRNGACVTEGCVTDLDCPLGEACDNGTCVPGECTNDSDCTPGEFCIDGVCVSLGCATDADCGEGLACRDGACVAATCTTDADCPLGEVCRNGTCVTEGCVTDLDCPAGQSCSNGNCVATPCTTDADCGPGEFCAAGTCQGAECVTDADCPLGEACVAGACVMEGCVTDLDCPVGEVCSNGQCVAGGCTSDADCSADERCVEGTCVRAGCTSNEECGPGRSCVNGACVDTGCTSNDDCPAGQMCIDGTCVAPPGCASDADCPSGQTCQNGTCAPPPGCTSDADCPSGQTCQNGTCSAAPQGVCGDGVVQGTEQCDGSGQAQCQSGFACVICRCDPVSSTATCGDGVCDTAAGERDTCAADCPSECGDNKCNATAGEPTSCPADCPSVECCVQTNGCPSEELYRCPGECCCCPYGARCVSGGGGWVCGF
ncbi:MAG: hypothetical protein AB2A00_11595 [Myxococcota bacterium]